MNDKKYSNTLYIIIVVILATIGIQTYWNYKNYLQNKQQLITDVQTSLDKAVDDYYSQLAHNRTAGLTWNPDGEKDLYKGIGIPDSILKSKNFDSSIFKSLDALNPNSVESITVIKGLKADSLRHTKPKNTFSIWHKDTPNDSELFYFKIDSTNLKDRFELLASKVIVSLKSDTLSIKKVDSLFQTDLEIKKIDLKYDLSYNKPKEQLLKIYNNKQLHETRDTDIGKNKNLLFVTSKSAFLPKGSALRVYFTNANWVALRRGISAVLISTLLVLAVISSLFFLLKVIKDQKQLAEVKNDLISNITHEFKTPIATIGVALEGINNFNVIEDKEKTKKYVELSSDQLSKLNVMVEKLLETATLDSESLKFNKEDLDITQLLDSLVNRYKTQHQEKTFHFNIEAENLIVKADPFHFENALNNILDNAIKYGGEVISVSIKKVKNNLEISISDNGNALKKESAARIFEKFYRVPKGNTHDVKGYGIGLFYTKTIINNHNGTIALDLSHNLTTFKIIIPNG